MLNKTRRRFDIHLLLRNLMIYITFATETSPSHNLVFLNSCAATNRMYMLGPGRFPLARQSNITVKIHILTISMMK